MSIKVPDPEKSQQVASLLPAEAQGYYDGMNKQHFGDETVGSRFTEAGSVDELLQMKYDESGNLEGDDRDFFKQEGVSPDAFMDQCRYLKVDTPGKLGIKKIADLSPDTPVHVVRTKPGAPCSLVVDVASEDELPDVDYGTIIVGPNTKENDSDPDPSTKEMVWTAHPGAPARPIMTDDWEEGSTITVKDVAEKLGDDQFLSLRVA